jgi:hypothetical protein
MLERDRIRNAAEKAWGATRRATDALILARSGELPPTTAVTSRGIRALARESDTFELLSGEYFTRITLLHGYCFYNNGMCEPGEETEQLIRETLGFILKAENLAGA